MIRPCLAAALLSLACLVSGCASDEYSQAPEPSGQWVPAFAPVPPPIPLNAQNGVAP